MNADGVEYIGASGTVFGYNIFAYCENDFIGCIDPDGHIAIKINGISFIVTYAIVTIITTLYNYSQNKKLSFPRSYINGQALGNAAKVRMGFWKDDHNGCGCIATFSALLILGRYARPKDIVKFYELSFGSVLLGAFGVNPLSIILYFIAKGYKVEITATKSKMDSIAKKYTANILLYFHSNGAHYVALAHRSSGYDVLNDSSRKNSSTYISSISSYLNSYGIAILLSIK